MSTEPAFRVTALHALACLERLLCLEEVGGIYVADAAVYAWRRLHEELATDEGETVKLILENKGLGIGAPRIANVAKVAA